MFFPKSPYISIFAPTKNLLPLTDLSVSEKREKKKRGEKHPKNWGIPSQKGLPQGGLPDDFVFLRLFEPGSERRKGWGFGGGAMVMTWGWLIMYIYIYTGFTKAIVHGKSEVEWCLVCIEI